MNEPAANPEGGDSSNGAARDRAAMDRLDIDGDIGNLAHSVDWAKTPLGPVDSWPDSLRTAASLLVDHLEKDRRKEAEEAFLRAQLAGDLKSKFLASMSHELRTPLNSIIGFSQLLSDQKPGALNLKQREYVNDILLSGEHLLELINEILDLAKIEAGKLELNPETFSIDELLVELCAAIAPDAQKKLIQISLRGSASLEPVLLDRYKIKQIFHNLLTNAVKFSNHGGIICITARRHESREFQVCVEDTGIGIRSEDIHRLFTEFVQLDPMRSEGTGLGLALTKKLTEMHGGTISVKSLFGEGSEFTVRLPFSVFAKRAIGAVETETPTTVA